MFNFFKDSSLKHNIEGSLSVLEKCFQDFEPHQVSVAFNGGKDNVAMIHLLHAYMQKCKLNQDKKLQALYIEEEDSFPEMEEFIQESATNYGLDLVKIKGPMKAALGQFLATRPGIKAMVLGTRQGDPGSQNQGFFAPTDSDWPEIMRVNPVLEWSYHDIWSFLRPLCVPYPVLYDRGYTSLGSRSNTKPNPHLAVRDEKNDLTIYKPAYELLDGSLERAGRVRNSSF